MNTRQTTTLATLKRVHDFVTSTPPATPLVPSPAALALLVTHLETAMTNIEAAASTQGSGLTKVTATQRAALRRTLRARYLIPIRHVARILARTNPGLADVVQLPKRTAGEAALLAAAQATVTDVTPYEAAFVARGLAPDFLTQLTASITALRNAADASITAKRQKLTATAALKAAITDGRDAVISLDHLIQTACDNDATNGPATRATWAHIQHAHHTSAAPLTILSPSTPQTVSTPAPSTPTPLPSATAA